MTDSSLLFVAYPPSPRLRGTSSPLCKINWYVKVESMKKSNLVTEKYLDERLGKFKSELNIEIDKKLIKFRDGLLFYIDEKNKPFEEMSKDFYNFKEQVLSRLDWLIGRYKKFEDEHTILTGSYSDVQVRLDGHEKRIGILEQKSS